MIQLEKTSPSLKVWSEDQCQKLHFYSLEILERTGIRVPYKRAREIYRKGGARVEDDMVFIPSSMVKEALESPPSEITLKSRGPEVYLKEGIANYGLGTDLPIFQDYRTGEYHKTMYRDIVETARLVDALPQMDFMASLGIAGDVDPYVADLYHFQAMYLNTVKPLLMTATDGENLKALLEMARTGAGGDEELREHPSFLLYTEPISPLFNSPEAHEKLIIAAENSLPVTYAAGITSGSTGPVTMAGNLALGNAEALGGLVLHQLVNPGAPFLYGIVAAPMDMQTTICVYGGPEIPLYFCIAGEMGRFYQLPTFGQAGATDSGTVDVQAAIDASFSLFVAALSGTNLIHDVGYIGNGLVGSLEMLLLCDEAIGMTRHLMRGISLQDESLALDLIHRVGPGGDYLSEEHTLKYFREENYYPRYLNRLSFDQWVHRGDKGIENTLKEEISSILESHQPLPVDEKIREAFVEIIEEQEEYRDRS